LQSCVASIYYSIAVVTDLANPLIAQHQHRTAFIALELAKFANLEPEITENIFTAALLHDIGAITVEEKTDIHTFQIIDENIHTIRGELLLEQIPWLRKISKIVRNHHKNWNDWEEGIDNLVVFSSQIVLLSDYVERLIDRNKYILHQSKDIVEVIKNLAGTVINKNIVDYFVDLSKREEFWLDLTSPRMYSLLLNNGQFNNMQIGLEDITLISSLYRDLIDFKSRFTATHTSGVSECAVKLSELFGFAELDLKSMRIAGNFHDIGKLVIPNRILEKPGKLTVEEFAIMRCHTYHTFNTVELLFDNYESINTQVKVKQAKALEFYERRFLSIANENKSKKLKYTNFY